MEEEKSFQEIDVERAINQSSFLFKYDTGLGKSYVLAACLAHLRSIGECHRAIILTSSIGLMNLAAELEKFIVGYDPSKTLTITSITKLKNRLVFDEDYDIIICGYDILKGINEAYKKALKIKAKTKFCIPLDKWFGDKKGLLFMDECHLIGSATSQRTKIFFQALPYFEYRYLFSATPADKKEKFYPLLKTLDESLVKGMSYMDWLGTFCEIGTKWSMYAPNTSTWDIGKWTKLQNDLADTYMAVREKSILGLPPAIDMPLITIDMSPIHRQLYELFSNINAKIISSAKKNGQETLVDKLINIFQILQLVVDNPLLIKASTIEDRMIEHDLFFEYQELLNLLSKFDYDRDFTKLQCLDNILDYECREMENKVLVFYYHPITLEALKQRYPDAAVISSDIPNDERLKIVNEFKKDPEKKVLIASIMIANTSFTLTECKAEVFYERQWSGIVHEQAKGRIHRIGSTEEVRYYTMCYNNSIDNIQLENLSSKGEIIKNLGHKQYLSPDEWKLIFGGSIEKQKTFLEQLS
ncbi:MAG: DEAD/DEAH box helicase family protein [Clostridia bacterium]|nr:DEAD/DEAH box helicase family protein [Clostridia bacterium]